MKNTAPTISESSFTLRADGWFDIENEGVHPNEEAGVVLVLDDEGCRCIIDKRLGPPPRCVRCRYHNLIL
jgi:hypothetical protein